ncbi:hypothetical protein ABW21_db0204182 [Orbilia brochopaga]|nr:hypothetical protein ABW21_db0204182 [Drechslerella brochopaga]
MPTLPLDPVEARLAHIRRFCNRKRPRFYNKPFSKVKSKAKSPQHPTMATATSTRVNADSFSEELDDSIADGKPAIRVFEGLEPKAHRQLKKMVSGRSSKYQGRFMEYIGCPPLRTSIVTIPSLAHECIPEFMRACWRLWEPVLPPNHIDDLVAMSRPLYDINVAQDVTCVQEPEYSICHNYKRLPNLVIEAGSPESYPRLLRNKDLWIHGNAARNLDPVEVVLILKVSTLRDQTITAFLEIWRSEPTQQRFIVLPKQEDEEEPFIYLKDIYGTGNVPGEFDPDQRLPLSLDWLRKSLSKCARKKHQRL